MQISQHAERSLLLMTNLNAMWAVLFANQRTPIALVAVNRMALSLSFPNEQRKCYTAVQLHPCTDVSQFLPRKMVCPLIALVMQCKAGQRKLNTEREGPRKDVRNSALIEMDNT